MSEFTDPGVSEATKGAVHGALLTLAVLCGAYNVCAWLKRRDHRLLVNCVVYAAIALFECWQVRRHCSAQKRHE